MSLSEFRFSECLAFGPVVSLFLASLEYVCSCSKFAPRILTGWAFLTSLLNGCFLHLCSVIAPQDNAAVFAFFFPMVTSTDPHPVSSQKAWILLTTVTVKRRACMTVQLKSCIMML